MQRDRFGNPFASDVPYARGDIITSTQDDLRKLQNAWGIMNRLMRANKEIFNFTGLERSLRIESAGVLDDELAPATVGNRLNELAIEHMGGNSDEHGVMVFNRQTAAIFAAISCMVNAGETVIGVSPTYSHPCVVRSVERVGANLVDTVGEDGFRRALSENDSVSLVVLTRLAVSYEILSESELVSIIELAHARGAKVLLDDAGGARVGPAAFDQPKALELGVDVASTGLDKYGTVGPRLGLMVGDKDHVDRIRALAFSLGLEARPMLYGAVTESLAQYRPARVRELIASTKEVAEALRQRIGERVTETPVIAKLLGEDILELALERSGLKETTVVPVEATAALAIVLLRDYGIHTVHLAAIPPGTSALLIKFLPPEVVSRFGGADAFAEAVDTSIGEVARLMADPAALRNAILGDS